MPGLIDPGAFSGAPPPRTTVPPGGPPPFPFSWGAPPPSTSTILSGSQTVLPDYTSLINQQMDPYQQLAQQQLDALQAANDKSAGFAQKAYDINASGYKEEHQNALGEIINALAARGMLQSGARGWARAHENRRYQRQTGLASNALAQYLAGLAQSLQQARLSSAASLAGLRLQIAPQVAAQHPAQILRGFSWS